MKIALINHSLSHNPTFEFNSNSIGEVTKQVSVTVSRSGRNLSRFNIAFFTKF
jgi:hypothetical protein